ncbi:MAG: energy-coupling factor ABC transporter ATP-binding protein [Erysipelotrichaceae bacterium]
MLINVDNVSFRYDEGYEAVKNVSFNVKKGETLAVIGQNGAGKTTMMKMLNGLFKPSKGKILIDGNDTKGMTTAKLARTIAYVFQNPDDQIFHDIVYEEIMFGPKNLGFPESKQKQLVKEAIQMTKVEDLINLHPYEIPYSTRKFITIASVIAMDPDVIILDEPTAGQDDGAIELLGEIVKTLKSKGKSVIVITHDMEYVVENYDRTIVMANKEKIFDGKTSDVFTNIELLNKANLEQPEIMKLAFELGIKEPIYKPQQLLDRIK